MAAGVRTPSLVSLACPWAKVPKASAAWLASSCRGCGPSVPVVSFPVLRVSPPASPRACASPGCYTRRERGRAITPGTSMHDRTAVVVLGFLNDERGVLSGVAIARCRQAIVEFRKHPGSRIIPTGGWGQHFNTTSKPHGHYLREYLERQGIPGAAIVECVESANTIDDARLCRPLVERYGFRTLIVVTSDFHMARARFLFTRAFPDVALVFSGARTTLPAAELQARIAHERNALAKLAGDRRS
jgi:uncharacterized SAM-binding protein YcdF (DUF218 family)